MLIKFLNSFMLDLKLKKEVVVKDIKFSEKNFTKTQKIKRSLCIHINYALYVAIYENYHNRKIQISAGFFQY